MHGLQKGVAALACMPFCRPAFVIQPDISCDSNNLLLPHPADGWICPRLVLDDHPETWGVDEDKEQLQLLATEAWYSRWAASKQLAGPQGSTVDEDGKGSMQLPEVSQAEALGPVLPAGAASTALPAEACTEACGTTSTQQHSTVTMFNLLTPSPASGSQEAEVQPRSVPLHIDPATSMPNTPTDLPQEAQNPMPASLAAPQQTTTTAGLPLLITTTTPAAGSLAAGAIAAANAESETPAPATAPSPGHRAVYVQPDKMVPSAVPEGLTKLLPAVLRLIAKVWLHTAWNVLQPKARGLDVLHQTQLLQALVPVTAWCRLA